MPVEGSANGKLVIDLTMHHLGRLLTPIELTVEKGRVVKIEGGAEARILRDYLEVYGDENAYMCPAEASVGVNAKAVVRGIQREDKNILGTLHFGLGTAGSAELNIRWPNGATERIAGVEADQLLVIREGLGVQRRQRFTQ